MDTTERIRFLDTAKVIAMLWIVGFWHLVDYVGPSYKVLTFKGDGFVTEIMLATFMLISGFFMSKYTFHKKSDYIAFYRKRINRFYYLYVIAAILLFLIGFNPGILRLFCTLTGLSVFTMWPSTLWFLGMLMMFYLYTPILLTKGIKSVVKYGSIVIVVCFVIHILLPSIYAKFNYVPRGIDDRFFLYFPTYCFGLIIGRMRILRLLMKPVWGGYILY